MELSIVVAVAFAVLVWWAILSGNSKNEIECLENRLTRLNERLSQMEKQVAEMKARVLLNEKK